MKTKNLNWRKEKENKKMRESERYFISILPEGRAVVIVEMSKKKC